jgi:signal peptidase I
MAEPDGTADASSEQLATDVAEDGRHDLGRGEPSDVPGGNPERPDEGRAGDAQRRPWRFVGSFPFLVLVALGVAIIIKSFLIQAFYIPSPSMEPTLKEGDRVLVYKLSYDVVRQDVVVFANPNGDGGPDRGLVGGVLHWLGEGIGVAQPADEDFIKRVIGLPGETLEIRDKTVLIDGEPLEEPYLTAQARGCNREFGPVSVPEDALFVMGDNRCNSADSRYGLGFVPVEKVIGHAFVIIWPPSSLGGLG